MRPVDRGAHPQNPDGSLVEFPEYSYARPYLIKRLGEYCSYCEMHLDASLATEHVRPKDPHPDLERKWDNFLLSCTNCNSTKGTKDIHLDDYYWPERHNTAKIFQYHPGGIVTVDPTLTDDKKAIANSTLKLTGLDKTPSLSNNLTASDRRWENRREAWGMAEHARSRLQAADIPEMREQIVDTALANGFLSVWLTVFVDDADMYNRLISASPGICRFCYDETYPVTSDCLHTNLSLK